MIFPTVRAGFRTGLVVCGIAVAALAFLPVDGPTPLTGYDKANHLLAFSVLAWLADGAYPGREQTTARWGLLLLYGLLIELIQYAIPYRHFSLLDFGADALGILVYVGAANLVSGIAKTNNGRWRREGR